MKSLLVIVGTLFFYQLSAQTFTESNLPIVIINTNGGTVVDDPKIVADMGIVYNGVGAINHVSDPKNHYNGKIGIEYRGQSSQQFPMKSYGFELWNNSSNTVKKSLLGLPSESDWILYAPYTDKTLMRNFLAYTFSREMGHWASNCRYVELMVNGEYRGIYILMEKIKRDGGRVNISKLNPTDITGDALTGGYIFSIDKEADGWFSSYPSNTTNGSAYCQFSYITPKITAIVPQQKDYIKQYVDSFENALMQSNFQDKQNGWRKFAQDSSFVDYFIVNEISRNVDGYRLSSFFHKDKYSVGGKIKAGPVWDFDLAFRNANYCSGSDTSGWAWQFNDVCAGDYWQVPFWWQRFNNDTAFTRTVLCRWKALRTSSLSDARIETLIDSVVNLTTTARTRHFQKWNTLGYYVWPNPQPIATSYTEEIQLLKTWIHNRIQWIDGHLKQEGECAYFPPNVTASLVVNIAPNPIVGDAKLYIQSSKDQMIAIQLYNMEGQLLQSFQKDVVRGMNSITQPMKTLAKGVYMIRIQSAAGEKFNKKFLKD